MIAHLKDQLQEMKAKTSMEGKYIKKDAEVLVTTYGWHYRSDTIKSVSNLEKTNKQKTCVHTKTRNLKKQGAANFLDPLWDVVKAELTNRPFLNSLDWSPNNRFKSRME